MIANATIIADESTTVDELSSLGLEELLARARAVRDAHHGTRVTFSPKVFILLTQLCRDRCGYCTFAHPPRRMSAPYLSRDDVLRIAIAGAEAGCHEALFTLGEAPEARYREAREWLDEHGYASTVDYLAAMCQAVLDETGLLPHANAGALRRDELARLRAVSPSQGMMVESVQEGLAAHRGAPDKVPARRLATLEAAGELRIPFTTGILVGFGESPGSRLASLRAIADIARRYGHVQEVIVQNFLPKPDTAMRHAPPCPTDDFVHAIALARLVLPPEIHVQAPPNLVDDVDLLLDAGVDDLGGISPVTKDHVNPERPWPHLDELRARVEAKGMALVPRLTAHPSYVHDLETWVDPALHFAVMDRSDASGLARDDPGAQFPERREQARNVGDGAEVVLVGRRSTPWYSGAPVDPVTLVPSRHDRVRGRVREVLDGVAAGQETGADELLALLSARGPEVAAVAAAADELRRKAVGDVLTFVRNRNINYTNVCTFKCRFCGFSKGPLSLNLRGTPYLLTLDQIAERAVEAQELGATEVCLQGGIHPKFDGNFYVDVTRAVHEAAPKIHIHGFTALEVTEGARRLEEPLEAYLQRLKDAGLRSLPGTAAEILDDDVRAVICADKINTQEWLDCHEAAHGLGLKSNVTIMFGSVERPESWVRHILVTRDLQRRTGGFTEFVGLPFVHMAAPIYLKREARRGPTWREVVLLHAVARIAYAGLIDHVQASWVKLGAAGATQLVHAGVDDLGGTLMNENISRAAGAAHGQGLDIDGFAAIAEATGRTLRQRTTLYGEVALAA